MSVVKYLVSLLMIVGLIGAGPLAAQDADRSVFAPFISALQVMPQGEEVAMTWRDSPDIEAGYQVLRSTEPINASNYARARVAGRVARGTEEFVDRPGLPGEYYYAVVAETPNGAVYPIFIPYRNTIANPVTVEPGPPPEERAAQIDDIQAAPLEGSVEVRFAASKEGRDLLVYRSTERMESLEALAAATRLATLPSDEDRFVDYPVPGVEYYYGVFDSELVALGLVSFALGENATAEAVGLPLAVTRETMPEISRRTIRQRPLPLLSVDREIETGRMIGGHRQPPLPETQEISDATLAAVEALRGNGTPPSESEPRLVVLPEDRIAVNKGPAFTLNTIVEGTLSRGRWEEAVELLNNLLSLPLGEKLAARSHFYLGQAHFFQDDYRLAFMEFLMAREVYFSAAEPWLDATLIRLRQ